MEEADKGWMMIRIGEQVNVSSGTGHPGSPDKGPLNGGSSSSSNNLSIFVKVDLFGYLI